MKLSLDDVLESEGPFVVLTVNKYNELKGSLGSVKRELEQANNSNEFLRSHIRKLEERLDE